ncbi:MAG: RsmE family RNA methyltransferase [bacterium]|nr:RsmE family RNA methyltransferase [bacterium]
MKIHRFYVSGDLSTGVLTIIDPEINNQIRNVLKLKIGEPVILFNGAGSEATAIITDIAKTGLIVEISKVRANAAEPKRFVRLYLAILKKEHFELAAQKAVECGVGEIIPVITSRTVKLALKPERVMKIMQEAAEQSGRGVVPRLADIVKFDEALTEATKHNHENFFCDGGAQSELRPRTERVGVWIGPEGGFSPEEVQKAHESGFIGVSLGSLTLRAETAAIVATYLVTH